MWLVNLVKLKFKLNPFAFDKLFFLRFNTRPRKITDVGLFICVTNGWTSMNINRVNWRSSFYMYAKMLSHFIIPIQKEILSTKHQLHCVLHWMEFHSDIFSLGNESRYDVTQTFGWQYSKYIYIHLRECNDFNAKYLDPSI